MRQATVQMSLQPYRVNTNQLGIYARPQRRVERPQKTKVERQDQRHQTMYNT